MQEKEIIQYVIAAEAKDNNAMEILYKEYYMDVMFICRNFKLSEEDSQDIAQDTFIKAFSTLSTLKDKSKFKQWLLRIANNKCLDMLRHNKVLIIDSMHANEEILELPDKSKSADDVVIEKETELILMSIIERLPIEQRATVFLYFYQDYSVKEIAVLYNCTESTVRSRLNYAKKFMQKEIEKLESKETKHRCIVMLPFLYVLFANQRKAFACEVPNSLNVISQAMIEGSINAPVGNVLSTVSSTGKAVALKMSVGKIVAICALALTLVVGGIGAVVYLISSNQEEESTSASEKGSNVGDLNDNKDKDDSGDNEPQGNVDSEVAEIIAKGKEELRNISIFDVHSTFGFLYGLDDMYIDTKNMIFEYMDGDHSWYIEKESDNKVYIYEPTENGGTSIMTKRELTEEEVNNLDYVAAMSTLFDAMNNEKAKVITDKYGEKHLACNMNMSVLETVSKYYKFDMIIDYTLNENNVTVDLRELAAELQIYIDDEYRITSVVVDSEKLEGDFMDTLTEEQKELMVVNFKFVLEFGYDHNEHEAPYVSDEIKHYAVPYTISAPYTNESPRYMFNIDCGWEGEINIYEDGIYGMKNGMEVQVFYLDDVRFNERNEELSREDVEKTVKGSGGYSSVFVEVDSSDISGFEWMDVAGNDVGICHTECLVENNYTTIVVVRLDLGDEKRVVCIQVTDRESVTYDEEDNTQKERKAVVLEVLEAIKAITVEKPVIDREKEWY